MFRLPFTDVSQGSSSVRIYLGAVFAAMAGDPLSVEVSTPSLSLTESVLKVASRLGDEGVARLAHEPATTSKRANKEEEEEMQVSCAYLRSTITMAK